MQIQSDILWERTLIAFLFLNQTENTQHENNHLGKTSTTLYHFCKVAQGNSEEEKINRKMYLE